MLDAVATKSPDAFSPDSGDENKGKQEKRALKVEMGKNEHMRLTSNTLMVPQMLAVRRV